VLHPPVLVALSLLARPFPVVPELKLLLVAALGVPACFTIGCALTRLPGASRVL
jgi:glucans biosynthesis protein C